MQHKSKPLENQIWGLMLKLNKLYVQIDDILVLLTFLEVFSKVLHNYCKSCIEKTFGVWHWKKILSSCHWQRLVIIISSSGSISISISVGDGDGFGVLVSVSVSISICIGIFICIGIGIVIIIVDFSILFWGHSVIFLSEFD